jgi:hypothetical protein
MEDFVTFDIAKKLKEKGFKEKCYAYYFPKGSELFFNHNPFRGGIVEDCLYSNNFLPNECMASDFVDAPTISQVLKWLREEKKIHIAIDIWGRTWGYDIIKLTSGNSLHWTAYNENINNYEQAALAGIEYVLDNLI